MISLLTALLFSGLLGWGLFISFRALTTPAVSLEAELERVTNPAPPDRSLAAAIERLGRVGANDLPSADLEILRWTPSEWYRRRLLFIAGGTAIGLVLALGLRVFFSFPLLLAAPALALIVGGLGLVTVDSDRATRAARGREEILLALSHYLEITSIMLAGGAGAETALEEAVRHGHGVGFQLFSQEVARAKDNPGMSPFLALRNLGDRLAVTELVEFGNVMILSSESSATVRRALDEKATQIVFRQQEKRKAAALSRNVVMSIPVAGMAGGFILWLVYPALAGLGSF